MVAMTMAIDPLVPPSPSYPLPSLASALSSLAFAVLPFPSPLLTLSLSFYFIFLFIFTFALCAFHLPLSRLAFEKKFYTQSIQELLSVALIA